MNNSLDVTAAYPKNQIAMNISKKTTKKEIKNIEGITEEVFRMQNINLVSGPVNALEYCQTMFGFPSLDDVLTMFKIDQY